jgi:hypothetical protein
VVISAVIALLLTQLINGGAAPLYQVEFQRPDRSALCADAGDWTAGRALRAAVYLADELQPPLFSHEARRRGSWRSAE